MLREVSCSTVFFYFVEGQCVDSTSTFRIIFPYKHISLYFVNQLFIIIMAILSSYCKDHRNISFLFYFHLAPHKFSFIRRGFYDVFLMRCIITSVAVFYYPIHLSPSSTVTADLDAKFQKGFVQASLAEVVIAIKWHGFGSQVSFRSFYLCGCRNCPYRCLQGNSSPSNI